MAGLDIIITGIPRSGTSYLCGLLNKVKNNVVINEPESMSGLLSGESEPHAAANYYQSVRKAVLAGDMIKNKMIAGKIIEDTAFSENLEMYHPKVYNDNFSICTKNTLGYLSRLEKFPAVMPDSPIFACIRNPIDTLASWKSTFDHLKQAVLASDFLIGSVDDIYLSQWQKAQLKIIAEEASIPRRRALIWAYLAEWIWINREILTIIDYNDVVLSPHQVLKKIVEKTGNRFELIEPVKPSEIRTQRRSFLEVNDYKALEEICYPVAEKINISHT